VGFASSRSQHLLGQADAQGGHEPLKIFERAGVPGDGLGSQNFQIDSVAVAGFYDKTREHSDAGAVEEIQLSKIEDDGRGWSRQRFFEQVENGRVIRRTAKAQSAFKDDGGISLVSLNRKRFPIESFQAETPAIALSSRTALVVTKQPPGGVG